MKLSIRLLAILLTVLLCGQASAQIGRAMRRGILGGSGRSASRSPGRLLRRDLIRDRATRIRVLKRDRLVARYTSSRSARLEWRSGIKPGTHFSSRLASGRPLRGWQAKRRFGLPHRPTARESVLLRRGTPVRFNKALGGRPGVGEIVASRRVRPQYIRKTVPIR